MTTNPLVSPGGVGSTSPPSFVDAESGTPYWRDRGASPDGQRIRASTAPRSTPATRIAIRGLMWAFSRIQVRATILGRTACGADGGLPGVRAAAR